MNREEIKAIIPHREPMLLVDEAEKIDETTARGRYTVRGDEWFLQGYFTGLTNVKFKQTVTPGDTLEITCTLTKQKSVFCFAKGEGRVNGKLAVSGEFSFALIAPKSEE